MSKIAVAFQCNPRMFWNELSVDQYIPSGITIWLINQGHVHVMLQGDITYYTWKGMNPMDCERISVCVLILVGFIF